MLRPELGDLSGGVLILESLCPAEHRKRLFFHNLTVHVLTTFQCHFDPKRSKGTDRASAFSQCGRCEAMEPGKGFGKAVRRIVAELQRDVDDFPVRREDLQPGGGEPALADVVAHRHAAQHGKPLLEVKRRQGRLLRDLPDGQLLPEMFLDILDRLMNACYPIHWSHRPSGSSIPEISGPCPIFRAHVCPVVCRFKTNSWAGWPNSSVSLLSEKPRRL